MSRRTLRRALHLSLVLALTPAATAWVPTEASAATPKDGADVKAARRSFQEGVRAYDRKDYEKARAAFLQAYGLHAHPALLLNIAQSSLNGSHWLEAATYFRRFLREGSPSAATASTAQQGLARAEQNLGRLDIRADAGLDVSVDGVRAGTLPLADPLDVEPGPHTVHVGVQPGGSDRSIVAMAGQVEVITFASPPVPSNGTAANAAPHRIGHPANMIPVYAAGVLVVAGVATGIVLSIAKGKADDQATSATALINANGGTSTSCTSTDAATAAKFGSACGALSTDNRQASTDGAVRDVGFIVGGAALIGGLSYFLLAHRADATAPAPADGASKGASILLDVRPIVDRTTQGLSVAGSF